jgi:putative flavoprotein involved in K+ transport
MPNEGAIMDAVVVGAGQAGLGVSYHLVRAGVRHRVLERGRIGESWRSQRWDAFRMNTINAMTVMPGQRYRGPDPEGFMSQHGWVELLEDCAAGNCLPVETDTPVVDLASVETVAGLYRVSTPRETILARSVVIASGGNVRPRLPSSAGSLSADLAQLHSADYRNPAGLPAGAMLVVGAGNSGCQIAEDLLDAGRIVYLATCRVGRLPRRYRGRDTIVWAHDTGFADERTEDVTDRSVLTRGRPQTAPGHTVSLQSLSAQGVVLLGRFIGTEGPQLRFADDLEENIAFADRASTAAKKRIDADIERLGLHAPPAEEDPAETIAPRLPDPPILSLDLAACGISAVIWCTGLDGDFGWVRLPGVLDGQGRPVHERGVTACAGIYFTGLPWLSARRSDLVSGVEWDAPRIAELVVAQCR